jgi:hypothetical protein
MMQPLISATGGRSSRRTAIPIRRLVVAVALILSACATSADIEARSETARIVAASRDVLTCRRAIAANPRYQALATHMPLVVSYSTTLLQMTDTALASNDDVVALGLWLDDIQECRRQIADAAVRGFPTSLAVLVENWNKDDEAFVLLATRKMAWGKTVMTLRANHAKMLETISRQTLQLAQQLNSEKQAELSRRIALFNAVTNLAP